MNHFRVKALFGFKLNIFGVELEEGENTHFSSGNCRQNVEDDPKFSQIKTANPECFPSFLHLPFPPL